VVKNAVVPGGSSLSAQSYSSLADVQKLITLRPFMVSVLVNNRWKDKKKSSITLVWDSPSYSRHITVRIEFSDCCSQSSQI
jgi:hypothetical protein